MKHLHLLCSLLLLFFVSCKPSVDNPSNVKERGGLIFQSGFENNSAIIPYGTDADIVGADQSLPQQDDWVNDLDKHPDIGDFWLQYQGGDETMRHAKIVTDPTNPSNKVLQFWLKESNVDQIKGRIQANLYKNKGFKEIYQSVRMFLPVDFEIIRKYPGEINWLTIAEYWNNIVWDQNVPYGFRITLGIGKPVKTESDLYFTLDAQDGHLLAGNTQKYNTIWSEVNKTVKVPIGKWFTMEYYYKEGNKDEGRYYMAITPEGESKQVIFDVKNITHNTLDPSPDGISDFNPMKLYTSKELINYMRSNDKTLQIYWDDFKLWKDKRPG